MNLESVEADDHAQRQQQGKLPRPRYPPPHLFNDQPCTSSVWTVKAEI